MSAAGMVVSGLLLGGLLLPVPALAQRTGASSPPPVAPTPGGKDAAGKTDEERKAIKSKDFLLKETGAEKFEQLAREKRGEAIDMLKSILDSGNVEGDQKAEMYMRLASLYSESANDAYLGEMEAYIQKYEAWSNSPDASKTSPPVEDHARSQQYNRMALELYRAILSGYKSYPRMDEVYFNLAYNLMDLGEKEKALEYYDTLVKSYPQSEFVPETYLAVGEYWFDNNNAFKALRNYQKAASFTENRIFIFASYKLAWCYYNVGDHKSSISTMKQVVASSEGQDQAGKISLRDEALNDLVLFFSDAGDIEAAYTYFAQFSEKKYYKSMLKRLASAYLEQGKNELAISTYQRLIDEDPTATDTPLYQGEIIGAYFKWGQKEKTIAAIDKLAAQYGPGSPWANVHRDNKAALDEANALVEKNLRSVAIDYHSEARKTRSQKTFILARNAYRKYLDLYPESKQGYDIRFNFAEVLYELKEYENAANEYERVIKLDPKGRHFEIATSSLIYAINKVLGVAEGSVATTARSTPATGSDTGATPPKQQDFTPLTLSEWERRKVWACDTFVEHLPQHEDAASTLYEGARLLYLKNQFEQSTPRFLTLIDRYGAKPIAEVAANLVLDSLNLRQDFDGLDKYARQFHQNPNFKEPFKKELYNIYEQASFKKIEPLEKNNQHAQALDAYVAFHREFPQSTLADRALFNAAFHAFKTGDLSRSIALREQLYQEFPKSDLTLKNLDALGRVFESVADYANAARYYEALAATDEKRAFDGTANALYNAALFRDSLGDWERAIQNYEAYGRDFPTRDDVHLTAMEIARIYQSHDRVDAALEAFKRVFSDKALSSRSIDVVFEARIEYGRALRKQNKRDLAAAHFRESMTLFEKLRSSASGMQVAPLYIAEMQFYLAEPLNSRYLAITLDLVKTRQGSRATGLEEKLKLAEEVVKAYTDVVNLKQAEWTVAGLFMVGEAYRHLAETLLSAPIPPELDADQKAIYLAALQDRAFPLRDKAAEAYEQTLAASFQIGLYNEYTQKAAALLAELRPKEYPALAERLGTPTMLSDSFFAADFMR